MAGEGGARCAGEGRQRAGLMRQGFGGFLFGLRQARLGQGPLVEVGDGAGSADDLV